MGVLDLIGRYAGVAPTPVAAIAAELGAPCVERQMPFELCGHIVPKDGGYEIAVNAAHAPERRRFTAAHLLGHLIYHRDLIGDGVAETRDYRSNGTPFENRQISISHERQASAFAANLLMPAKALSDAAARAAEGVIDQAEVASLAKRFGVTEPAMRIRLGA